MFVFARISLGTPMREATRGCPAPKGKRRFSGRGRKKSRPQGPKPREVCAGDLLWKEPEKQSRAAPAGRRQSTKRVTEREQGKTGGMARLKPPARKGMALRTHSPETALSATQPSSHSTAAKHGGEYTATSTALLSPPAQQAGSEMVTE